VLACQINPMFSGFYNFTIMFVTVERYREYMSGSERYQEFKRGAVSRVREQVVMLVEQREED